jgi:uncharacterized protein
MLTIILKATEYCNANCVYCAVRDKETKRERMSVDLLHLVVDRMREYLSADPDSTINVTWHGGEPALMGAAFYRTMAAYQRQLLGAMAKRVQHTIQSNVTLLDDDLALAFKGLGISSVGTSYEYAQGLRRLGSQEDGSEAYARRFFEGLEVLRRHGLGAGVIYVVTSRTVDRPVETMIFLQNLLGKRHRDHFRINPMYAEGEASRGANQHLAVTPDQYGHFLGKAYQHWYRRRAILPHVVPFSNIRSAVDGEAGAQGCEEAGVCGDTHLSIGPSGDVFQCGRAMDNGALRYGSVVESPFGELLANPLKRELIQRSATLRAGECAGCDLWTYCHGGCPVDAHIYKGDWRQRTHFCATKRILFDEYVLPLHEADRGARAPERARVA